MQAVGGDWVLGVSSSSGFLSHIKASKASNVRKGRIGVIKTWAFIAKLTFFFFFSIFLFCSS